MPKSIPARERFDSRINKLANGCWQWTGTVSGSGYGVLWVNGEYKLAHRLAVVFFVGMLSDGWTVCHTCDNKLCVNPSHLFIGTQQDNVSDMVAKGRHANQVKTHCSKGHEYNEENTYVRKDRGGGRQCKVCNRESNRKTYYRRKAKEVA